MTSKNGKPARAIKATALAMSVLFGLIAHAESNQAGSRQTVLHIRVVVMPVLQTLNLTPSPHPDSPVTFKLDTTPHETRYEMRALSPHTTALLNKKVPAILRTLVIVPE